MKVINKFHSYGPGYAYFSITEDGNVKPEWGQVECTDWFTDKLSYPKQNFPTRDGIIPSKLQLIVNLGIVNARNFIKYGLPILNKIERINGIKRTKVIQDEGYLIVFASNAWRKSTFHLSFYLKAFRVLCTLTRKPESFNDFSRGDTVYKNPLLWKLLFSGKLKEVNSGCKYKHGYAGRNQGTHSNCGVAFTIYLYKNPDDKLNIFWERRKSIDSILESTSIDVEKELFK
jgi:hypothetical protein